MITYTIIGIIWSIFLNWMLTNFSDDGTGLDTIKLRVIHIFAWPLGMFLVIYSMFSEDAEDEE
jgi:uncharacterized membrane protein